MMMDEVAVAVAVALAAAADSEKASQVRQELQQSSSCGSAPLSSAQLSNELVKFQLFVLLPSLLPPLLLRLVSKSFSGFSQ